MGSEDPALSLRGGQSPLISLPPGPSDLTTKFYSSLIRPLRLFSAELSNWLIKAALKVGSGLGRTRGSPEFSGALSLRGK